MTLVRTGYQEGELVCDVCNDFLNEGFDEIIQEGTKHYHSLCYPKRKKSVLTQ